LFNSKEEVWSSKRRTNKTQALSKVNPNNHILFKQNKTEGLQASLSFFIFSRTLVFSLKDGE
jgi:hypothetical protein